MDIQSRIIQITQKIASLEKERKMLHDALEREISRMDPAQLYIWQLYMMHRDTGDHHMKIIIHQNDPLFPSSDKIVSYAHQIISSAEVS